MESQVIYFVYIAMVVEEGGMAGVSLGVSGWRLFAFACMITRVSLR